MPHRTANIRTPRISVLLPVYNGELYVSQAIQSVLNQSYSDFELIISDNASTDKTIAICRDAERRDKRVRLVQSKTNRGLAWNFNRAFKFAKGGYVCWLPHDDLFESDYLLRCLETIEEDRGAALVYSSFNYINELGCVAKVVDPDNPGSEKTASQRFLRVLDDSMCDPICGLIRTAILKQTRLHGSYADSDRVLLAEIALRGRFKLVRERLYSRRFHDEQLTRRCHDRWERSLVYDPSISRTLTCPWVREITNLLIAVWLAPLSLRERYLCIKYLYWWFSARRRCVLDDLRRGLLSSAGLVTGAP
jgi:glycosyltransferase involved in cell wall biosynthesis